MAAKRKKTRRPKGHGSIYQAKDGAYIAQQQINGRLVRRRATTRQEAESKLAELQELRRQEIDIHGAEQTLGVWMSHYFNLMKQQRNLATSTQRNYRNYIELYILPGLGDMRLCDLRSGHIQEWASTVRAGVQERGRDGTATLNAAAVLLKAALQLAVDRQLLAKTPFAGIILPTNKPAPVAPASREQLTALLDAGSSTRLGVLWHIYAQLGLRRGEGLGLMWLDYDQAARTIQIRRQVYFIDGRPALTNLKTPSSNRTLPVPKTLATMLDGQWDMLQVERLKPDWHEQGLMFPNTIGGLIWPGNLETAWYALRDKAGLPATFKLHHLRHTAATMFDEAGASETIKAAILGHAKQSMTQHYTHARLDAMRKVLEGVSELVLGRGNINSQIDSR